MAVLSERMKPIIDRVGGDRPLGRLLLWGELRHQLLSALERLSGTSGSLTGLGDDPRTWMDLCQHRRLQVEDSPGSTADVHAAVLAGYAMAIRRLIHPHTKTIDLRCRGRFIRHDLDAIETHDVDCPCAVFDQTYVAACQAADGIDPWARFAAEAKVWVGYHGLLHPHVVYVERGAPTPWPADDATPFAWGYRGAGPSLLAQSILVDMVGPRVESALVDRFAREVVGQATESQPAVFRSSDIDRWIRSSASRPGGRRRWPWGRRR